MYLGDVEMGVGMKAIRNARQIYRQAKSKSRYSQLNKVTISFLKYTRSFILLFKRLDDKFTGIKTPKFTSNIYIPTSSGSDNCPMIICVESGIKEEAVRLY